MLPIYIGYDPRETIAYHVLAHSILSRATIPVAITPLRKPVLRSRGLYWRKDSDLESTDFSLTRFLVPALNGYTGLAVFMDCDMLCRVDIARLFDDVSASLDPWSIACVPHDYTPKSDTKFLGHTQTPYARKNWSSFMVLNCAHLYEWTLEYVNTARGLDLHQFAGIDDAEILALDPSWNHLVGEYDEDLDASIFHYTLGGPWFPDTPDTAETRLWWSDFQQCLHPLVDGADADLRIQVSPGSPV